MGCFWNVNLIMAFPPPKSLWVPKTLSGPLTVWPSSPSLGDLPWAPQAPGAQGSLESPSSHCRPGLFKAGPHVNTSGSPSRCHGGICCSHVNTLRHRCACEPLGPRQSQRTARAPAGHYQLPAQGNQRLPERRWSSLGMKTTGYRAHSVGSESTDLLVCDFRKWIKSTSPSSGPGPVNTSWAETAPSLDCVPPKRCEGALTSCEYECELMFGCRQVKTQSVGEPSSPVRCPYRKGGDSDTSHAQRKHGVTGPPEKTTWKLG